MNSILRWLTVIIPPAAGLLLLRLLVTEDLWEEALRGTVAAAVAMVPDGLVLLTSLSFIVGVVALARRKALARELASVELLARVDILCLDKTGTITTGDIAFAGIETIGATTADEAAAPWAPWQRSTPPPTPRSPPWPPPWMHPAGPPRRPFRSRRPASGRQPTSTAGPPFTWEHPTSSYRRVSGRLRVTGRRVGRDGPACPRAHPLECRHVWYRDPSRSPTADVPDPPGGHGQARGTRDPGVVRRTGRESQGDIRRPPRHGRRGGPAGRRTRSRPLDSTPGTSPTTRKPWPMRWPPGPCSGVSRHTRNGP